MAGEEETVAHHSGSIGNHFVDADKDFIDEGVDTSLRIRSHWGAVVYRRTITVKKKYKFTIFLYFPNTIHTNNHGGRAITDAQIAEINIMYGKWSEWTELAVYNMADSSGIGDRMNATIDAFYSDANKKARSEWTSVFKSGNSRSAFAILDREIAKTEQEYRSVKGRIEDIEEDLKNGGEGLWNKVPSRIKGLDKMSIWVSRQKGLLRIEKSNLLPVRKTKWMELSHLKAKSLRAGIKQKVLDENLPYSRFDEAAEYRRIAEEYGLKGNIPKKMKYEQMAILRLTPYAFGLSMFNIVENAAKKARTILIHALLGSKSPDIQPKTKYNRKSRGNPTSPPLNETGEFAKSLQYVVIREKL